MPCPDEEARADWHPRYADTPRYVLTYPLARVADAVRTASATHPLEAP